MKYPIAIPIISSAIASAVVVVHSVTVSVFVVVTTAVSVLTTVNGYFIIVGVPTSFETMIIVSSAEPGINSFVSSTESFTTHLPSLTNVAMPIFVLSPCLMMYFTYIISSTLYGSPCDVISISNSIA
ncbi:MAG: hypothetical protein QXL96_09650 [Ignisphaera sp.]